MIKAIYNRNTNKIIKYISLLKETDYILNEGEGISSFEPKDCSRKDIREFNEDGSAKSLEQCVEENIIELKENEEIRNGVIYTLNPSYEEDKIKLIKKGLLELDKKLKIVSDEDSEYITLKNEEELFSEGVLSSEDYNDYLKNRRKGDYRSDLDGDFFELCYSIINELISEDLLSEDIKLKYNKLLEQRELIKEKYKYVN